MGKIKQKQSSKLSSYVNQYPVFKTDGSVLYCKLCNKSVSADKLFNVKQHLQGINHKALEGKQTKEHRNQQLITQNRILSKTEEFAKDLCDAFVSADIPLYKIRNEKLKLFLQKYSELAIPSESTLRRNIDGLYEQTMDNIRNEIRNKYVWISIDETTDKEGRYIGNVIIGVLDSEGPSKKMLLNSAILEKADHVSIANLFDNSIKLLGTEFQKDNILLFISDAAPYMKKAASAISVFYPKIMHLTCLAHALHRVCETIRDLYPNVDKLVATVKKIFLKAPSRISRFKQMEPDLPLVPEPITTRWGTWLQAVGYYAENYEKITRIVNALDCEEAHSIKIAQKLLSDSSMQQEIIFINSNFNFLVNSIK